MPAAPSTTSRIGARYSLICRATGEVLASADIRTLDLGEDDNREAVGVSKAMAALWAAEKGVTMTTHKLKITGYFAD